MTQTPTPLSPLQEYEERGAALMRLHELARAVQDNEPLLAAIDWALAAWKGTHYTAVQLQRAFDTRHFCRLCYQEILRGEQRSATVGSGYMHPVCQHLAWGESLPDLRRRLQQGTVEHSERCYDHRHGATCPIIDGGAPLPVVGPKRSTFSEPR